MIIDRSEFKKVISGWSDSEDFSLDSSPVWAQENSFKICSEWFVCCPVIGGITNNNWRDIRDRYRQWCADNLTGNILCYYSSTNDDIEWWGFGNKDDIVLWSLKWL